MMTQRLAALLFLIAAAVAAQKPPVPRDVTAYLAWLKGAETARRQAHDATAARGDQAGYLTRLTELQGRIKMMQTAPASCRRLHAAYLAAFALEVSVQEDVARIVAGRKIDQLPALKKRGLELKKARRAAGEELAAVGKALGFRPDFSID